MEFVRNAATYYIPLKFIARNYHVSLIGGASEIGQTVALLLRTQPSITKLTLYDTQEQIPGVALDLSHIPASSTVQGYSGDHNLEKALTNVDLVLATGGSSRHPGVSEKIWFETNSEYIKMISARIAKISPMPFVGIATEPINTLVPMAAEIMRNHGDFNPKKLFGITSINLLKAKCLFATENDLNPRDCFVPVIGGHSNKTIIPLVSQSHPACDMNERKVQEFTTKMRSYEDLIIKGKNGWSPSLSVAFGVFIFTRGIIDALEGRTTQVSAYVENNDFGTSYFSGLVNVDQNGARDMQRYTNLSKYEYTLLEQSIEELRKDVMLGKKILELA